LTEVFKSKTREEWCATMEGTDICFAPVLTMTEAPRHPHMAARGVFVERHGVTQPAPAPRFSRTPSNIREPETAELGAMVSEWKKGR
jgi:alpha-methylacyl-CoA racemase